MSNKATTILISVAATFAISYALQTFTPNVAKKLKLA